jgi:general secretion pathway protein C
VNVQHIFSRLGDQSPEQLLAQASERLPFWISLLLVALLAWYLAKLAWALYPESTEVDWQPPAALPRQAAASATTRDYTDLSAAQLFGQAGAEPEPEPVAQDVLDAPDTRLNLSLRAAVASSDQRSAHAIIADGSGDEQTYFLRDSIPGGATLHQVHADRVILNRGGVLEALRLPREFAASNTVSRSRSRAPSARPTVQQLVQDNAASFTDVVRPQPFMPNGQLRGYRVYPGRNRQQFAALGLRPGDLVTEINGMALNNPAEGMQIFRSLGDSTQVTVTVERNGQSQVMTLDTAQVADAGSTTQ